MKKTRCATIVCAAVLCLFSCASANKAAKDKSAAAADDPPETYQEMPPPLPPAAQVTPPPLPAEVFTTLPLTTGPLFSDLFGKIWLLTELRVGDGVTIFDRDKMKANNQGSMFIVQFTADGVSGQAAPNRYFATYKTQSQHTLTLEPIVNTKMAAGINIGGLMEVEYIYYLQHINRWEYGDDRLRLSAPLGAQEDAVLVFKEEK